jgi:hypothetical protein
MICQIDKFYREAVSDISGQICNRVFLYFSFCKRERERERETHTHTHTHKKRFLTQIFKSCLVFDIIKLFSFTAAVVG